MAGPVVWTPYCGIAPEPAEWLVRWNGDPILIGLILLAVPLAFAQTKPDALAQVQAALDAQVTAWNSGALEKSASVYYDSPEMLWVNRTGIRKGTDSLQRSFRRPQTDRSRPGTYSYEPLQILQLSPNCVYFVIRWKMEQNGRNSMTGVTSLVWKRINKKWVIVAEHAS